MMSYTYKLIETKQLNKDYLSAFLIISDGADYKRSELPRIPVVADLNNYLQNLSQTDLHDAFVRGVDVSPRVYDALEEKSNRETIQRLIFEVMPDLEVNGLDSAFALANSILNDNVSLKSRFLSIASHLGYNTTSPFSNTEKRDLTLLAVQIALNAEAVIGL